MKSGFYDYITHAVKFKNTFNKNLEIFCLILVVQVLYSGGSGCKHSFDFNIPVLLYLLVFAVTIVKINDGTEFHGRPPQREILPLFLNRRYTTYLIIS